MATVRTPPSLFKLFAFILMIDGLGIAHATPITELIGDVHINPTAFASELSVVTSVVTGPDGNVYIAGSLDGRPAYQSFTVENGTPQLAPVQILTVPNTVSGQGLVYDIAVINGEVVLGGYGRTTTILPEAPEGIGHALTWNLSGEYSDHGVASPGNDSSVYHLASNGLVVGRFNDDDAAAGQLLGQLTPLPQLGQVGGVLSATRDGKILVGFDGFGAAIWRADGANSYEETTTFEESPVGGSPQFFTFAFSDTSTRNLAFAEYLDLDFVSHVGAWDINTGAFLRDLGIGGLMDIMEFGDSLVLAINSPGGGYLTTFEDPTITLTLDELFADVGLENILFTKGGLFQGSLGVFAQGSILGEEVFLTMSVSERETGGSGPTVPEPTSVLLLGLGCGWLSAYRRRLSSS